MSNSPPWLTRFLLWLSGAGVAEDAAAPTEPPLAPPPPPARPVQPPPAPLSGLSDAAAAAAAAPSPPLVEDRTVPNDVINDATAYGVAIAAVDVPVGTAYWRAVRVHHLTPEENHGNHHIYVDALDEDGRRVYGAQARITWEGGEQVITIDKPPNEPGTNFPMWKWQVCAVEMLGLPSDRVTNLHTGHPDEPPGAGNTLFHHSFHVDFRRSVKTSPAPPQNSVIAGVVSNAAGLTLLLTRDGAAVASTVLDSAGAFEFANLAAGTYQLVVEGVGVQSELLTVDGLNTVTVTLSVPATQPPPKPIERYLLFGAPASPRTAVYMALAREYLATRRPTLGFNPAEARLAQRVVVVGEYADVSQEVEAELIAAGCQVRRLRGTPEEIAAAFKTLDSGGQNVFLPTTPVNR